MRRPSMSTTSSTHPSSAMRWPRRGSSPARSSASPATVSKSGSGSSARPSRAANSSAGIQPDTRSDPSARSTILGSSASVSSKPPAMAPSTSMGVTTPSKLPCSS